LYQSDNGRIVNADLKGTINIFATHRLDKKPVFLVLVHPKPKLILGGTGVLYLKERY